VRASIVFLFIHARKWLEAAFKRSQSLHKEREFWASGLPNFSRACQEWKTHPLRYDVRLMFSRRTDWKLAANRFTNALDEARASGSELIDLTISNPTRAGLIYDSAAILDALRNDRSLDYDPQSKGLLSAREAVTGYYRDRGETVDPESLILTTGTSEAYSFVFRLLANPGDEILVAKPSYPLFDFLADLQDVKLIPYSLIYDHGWQIDSHTLEQAVTEKSRAIVLVHPNNPTGSYVSPPERERLNELCRKHNLALLVDEVFLDYGHDGSGAQSFVGNNAALTFALSGISKISALPQMKLGWIAVSGPGAQVKPALDRLELIADTYLSVSAPVQWAASTFVEQRKSIQAQLVARIRKNLTGLNRRLAAHTMCSRLELEAGWYAVLRVPVTRSDEELAISLLQEKRVIVHPGHFYDFPQEGYLVLSLIAEEDHFDEGVQRLLNFFGDT
jgi:alanine-synthesizing transaminase